MTRANEILSRMNEAWFSDREMKAIAKSIANLCDKEDPETVGVFFISDLRSALSSFLTDEVVDDVIDGIMNPI